MGVGTIGENVRRQTLISKADKVKTEDRDGGRAKGTEEATGKDTEARAEKDMAAKVKESVRDTEAKACMVWIR